MQTIPNSTLYLCKNVDLDPNYNYTIDFDNITAQATYFDSKIATEFEINEGYSYVRDTQALKVQANIDDLLGINYLFYNNGNKRYYAFITKKEYISSTCTSLSFKLDVLQSFMFEYEIDESFIEREHQDRYKLNDDQNKYIPIYSLEKENLNIGNTYEVQLIKELKAPNMPSSYNDIYFAIVIASDEFTIPTTFYSLKAQEATINNKLGMTLINGLPTSAYTYIIPIAPTNSYKLHPQPNSSESINIASYTNLNNLLSETNIINIAVYKNAPLNLTLTGNDLYLNMSNVPNFRGITYALDKIGNTAIIQLKNMPKGFINHLNTYYIAFDREKPIDFMSYTNLKDIDLEPKLDTDEFSYIQAEIGTNLKQKYNIEDFNDYNYLNFKFLPQVTINGGTSLIPLDYQKDLDFSGASISSNILYDLPLVQDNWKQYLASNKNSLQTGFVTSAIQTASSVGMGILSGNIAGLILNTGVSSATQIASQMAKLEDIKATPDKVTKSSIDPYIDLLMEGLKINIKLYSIKDYFKVKVFNYLYRYGYKCNEFKIPNRRSRYYFNYLKTIDCNINSNIDNDYITELKAIYDKGVTIWHYRNATTFKGVNNFNYENAEINLMEV